MSESKDQADQASAPAGGRFGLWVISFVLLLLAGVILVYGAARRSASTSPASLSWLAIGICVVAIVLAVVSLRQRKA